VLDRWRCTLGIGCQHGIGLTVVNTVSDRRPWRRALNLSHYQPPCRRRRSLVHCRHGNTHLRRRHHTWSARSGCEPVGRLATQDEAHLSPPHHHDAFTHAV